MRKLSLFLLLLVAVAVSAKNSIRGKVYNETQKPIVGATVTLKQLSKSIATDKNGEFLFENLTDYAYSLQVKSEGYENYEKIVKNGSSVTIFLLSETRKLDEIIVTATRAGTRTPMTYNNVSAEKLYESGTAENIPSLISSLPSVVAFTEGGTGVGNTSLRVRGTDATRINVTLNGMPLNNPASQEMYWVNLPNLSATMENIQLQRGIGTSTNGSAAFGASLSMKTASPRQNPYGEASTSVGSYNSFLSTIAAGTGIMKNGLSLDARYSRVLSDGYIRNGSANHKNFFSSLSHRTENQLMQLIYLYGDQKTGITWEGVTQEQIDKYGRRYNPAGEYKDDARNIRYHDNETDNYTSNIAQFLFTRKFTDVFSINVNLSYNHGSGYYENWKSNQKLKSKFGFEPQVIDGKTYERSDVIRQKWMDNNFYVANISANYFKNSWKVQSGAMYSLYDGDHFGCLPWVKYNQYIDPKANWYENNVKKQEVSAFAKVEYDITEKWSVFGDLQARLVDFQLNGLDDDFGDLTMDRKYRFINPKAGLFYILDKNHALYASVALSNREPLRADLKDAVKWGSKADILPERMVDYELGYKLNINGISASANLYYMDYYNQMVQTGKLSDTGYKLMENVKDSYRAGIELEIGLPIVGEKLRLDANATLNQNKIKDYTAYHDVYDEFWNKVVSQKSEFLQSTNISFSPNIIGSGMISYQPIDNLKFRLIGKYVGKQFLDNTSNKEKSIPAYFVSNASVNYSFKPMQWGKIELDLFVNNLLGTEYVANGYASTSFVENSDDTPYHYVGIYPQATRNFMLRITVKF